MEHAAYLHGGRHRPTADRRPITISKGSLRDAEGSSHRRPVVPSLSLDVQAIKAQHHHSVT
jgi:hypothetical protein